MTLTPEMVEPDNADNQPSVLLDEIINENQEGENVPSEETSTQPLENQEGENVPSEETSTQPLSKEGEASANAKEEYSPEELDYLLSSDQDIDTDRLSKEGKILVRQFQRAYTKKFQSLADQRKELEQKSAETNDPNEKLYQEYSKNPVKIVREINSAIEHLEQTDPYGEESRLKIARLHSMKDDLALRRQEESIHLKKVESISNMARAKIVEEIPNFKEKAPKLSAFANEIGLSNADLEILSDPLYTGEFSVKITKALNKAYDIINANKTANHKQIKKPPPKLQSPGSGSNFDNTEDLSDLSYEEYKKRRSAKAR